MDKNTWVVLTVRMKVSYRMDSSAILVLTVLIFLQFLEPIVGLLRFVRLPDGNHSHWRQEYEQKWRGPPIQCSKQDLALTPLDESVTRLPQIFLLPE